MANKASEEMKITAKELLEMGMIEQVIPEYGKASKENLMYIGLYLKIKIAEFLCKKIEKPINELIEERYERFRKM